MSYDSVEYVLCHCIFVFFVCMRRVYQFVQHVIQNIGWKCINMPSYVSRVSSTPCMLSVYPANIVRTRSAVVFSFLLLVYGERGTKRGFNDAQLQ